MLSSTNSTHLPSQPHTAKRLQLTPALKACGGMRQQRSTLNVRCASNIDCKHRPLSRVLFRVCRSRCDDACFRYRTPHATAGRHGCHCCHGCKHCRQNVLAHAVWHRVYRQHECDRRCAKHRCRRLRSKKVGQEVCILWPEVHSHVHTLTHRSCNVATFSLWHTHAVTRTSNASTVTCTYTYLNARPLSTVCTHTRAHAT